MAIRIQVRRDTAANWTSNNPVLYPGEIGIEIDTKKFKIGPAVVSPAVATAWNSISTYANVVPSDLSNTLNDYILAADLGEPDGPAKLNVDGNLLIPEDSIIFEGSSADAHETTLTVTNPTEDRTITLPNATGTVALAENVAALSGATFTGNISVPTAITFEGATANDFETTIQVTDPTADRTITFPDAGGTVALTTNIPSTTDNLSEGSTNKYYTDERAQDAIATAIAAGTHTNITITYDDDNNKFTFVGANTYSDENAQDAIGNAVGTGLSYNDTTGAISVDTTAIQARVTDVSDTEIGYLNGVTSAIQTQLDAKASLSGATFTGAVSGTSLTLSGDLTVNGTTTTLNSTTISVDDKNIELGSVATPSDSTADGGGITLKGTTDKTFNWVDATDAWTSSEHINLASGKSLYLNGTLLKDTAETLTNKTLTSPVISTITNTGTLTLPTTTGTLALTSQLPVSSATAISSNSAVTIDTIALASFVSAEYQLTIKQGSSIRSSKVLVQTDGSVVDYSEYGIVTTGTAIAGVAVAASVSSTNMILQVTITDAATTSARASIIKNSITPPPSVAGGTLSSDATYYYRAFTSSGSLVVSSGSVAMDTLVIAGGGGGGNQGGGGGGAGGLVYVSTAPVAPGTYSIVVGAGGSGSSAGSSSSFDAYSATGGGEGGTWFGSGGNGGSGGGAGKTGTGGLGISGQGYNGGNGNTAGNPEGGGGGGAGQAGQNGGSGGNGGNGSSAYSSWLSVVGLGQDVSGTYWIAGGGGGAAAYYSVGGTGGNGGGSGGGGFTVASATANTGGGGGGCRGISGINSGTPGTGGSGTVIVRYTKESVGG